MKQHWFKGVIDSIAERGREILGLDNDVNEPLQLPVLCRQLLSGQGEASGIALSQEILRHYQEMEAPQKLAFFQMLQQQFAPDIERIDQAIARYQQTHAAEDLLTLNNAVEPPRQELFRRLNMAPHGTASLVALRADLLKWLREYPELRLVDADLRHLLSSWFNRGFLQLSSIDWTSPAHILEKLINYESVHEIRGWDDLRRRLMQDRRCFAFFHPAMPDEPLIFVEVAFVQGLSTEVTSLLNPDAPLLEPKQADTAIFYSINNTQAGLRGISFGNFLIKQVLTEVSKEFPWIQYSSTLSPIPTFASALTQWLQSETSTPQYAEFDAIAEAHRESLNADADACGVDTQWPIRKQLASLLENHLQQRPAALGALLGELALSYLSFANENGKLADPVAMFHLSNGARLERLNPFADMSEHGIASSYGVMVNYLYDLKDVELNHENFVNQGQIAMSDTLEKIHRKFIRPHID